MVYPEWIREVSTMVEKDTGANFEEDYIYGVLKEDKWVKKDDVFDKKEKAKLVDLLFEKEKEWLKRKRGATRKRRKTGISNVDFDRALQIIRQVATCSAEDISSFLGTLVEGELAGLLKSKDNLINRYFDHTGPVKTSAEVFHPLSKRPRGDGASGSRTLAPPSSSEKSPSTPLIRRTAPDRSQPRKTPEGSDRDRPLPTADGLGGDTARRQDVGPSASPRTPMVIPSERGGEGPSSPMGRAVVGLKRKPYPTGLDKVPGVNAGEEAGSSSARKLRTIGIQVNEQELRLLLVRGTDVSENAGSLVGTQSDPVQCGECGADVFALAKVEGQNNASPPGKHVSASEVGGVGPIRPQGMQLSSGCILAGKLERALGMGGGFLGCEMQDGSGSRTKPFRASGGEVGQVGATRIPEKFHLMHSGARGAVGSAAAAATGGGDLPGFGVNMGAGNGGEGRGSDLGLTVPEGGPESVSGAIASHGRSEPLSGGVAFGSKYFNACTLSPESSQKWSDGQKILHVAHNKGTVDAGKSLSTSPQPYIHGKSMSMDADKKGNGSPVTSVQMPVDGKGAEKGDRGKAKVEEDGVGSRGGSEVWLLGMNLLSPPKGRECDGGNSSRRRASPRVGTSSLEGSGSPGVLPSGIWADGGEKTEDHRGSAESAPGKETSSEGYLEPGSRLGLPDAAPYGARTLWTKAAEKSVQTESCAFPEVASTEKQGKNRNMHREGSERAAGGASCSGALHQVHNQAIGTEFAEEASSDEENIFPLLHKILVSSRTTKRPSK